MTSSPNSKTKNPLNPKINFKPSFRRDISRLRLFNCGFRIESCEAFIHLRIRLSEFEELKIQTLKGIKYISLLKTHSRHVMKLKDKSMARIMKNVRQHSGLTLAWVQWFQLHPLYKKFLYLYPEQGKINHYRR